MNLSRWDLIRQKVHSRNDLKETLSSWEGQKTVFTNGCFDILHYGHIYLLSRAADMGDKLIIGLNSDSSVCRLKGPNRPINHFENRATVLAALAFVDIVVPFEEDTPYSLIQEAQPDILVKGGDYQPGAVIGADIVQAKGGRVEIIPFVEGFSTTNIEEKIRGTGQVD